MPFHKPINNVPPDPVSAPITVTAARPPGGTTLTVNAGALFGTPSPAVPIWVSVFRAGAPVTVLEVTGKASNVLTVTGAAPSSIDTACLPGDTVMMCPTADSFLELQTAVDALQVPGWETDAESGNLIVHNLSSSTDALTLIAADNTAIFAGQIHTPYIFLTDYNYNVGVLGDPNWGLAGTHSGTSYSTQIRYIPNMTGDIRCGIYASNTNEWIAWGDTNSNFQVAHQLSVAPSQVDYSIAMGTFGLQSYAVNAAWLGDNIYYNGGWKYKADGYGATVHFVNGSIEFHVFAHGTAGAAATPIIAFAVDNSSNVIISGIAFVGGMSATGSGPTGSRPTTALVGGQWYDTTISQPIWWTGSAWTTAGVPPTLAANQVYAGPTTGAPAAAAGRALIAADVPDLSASYMTVAAGALKAPLASPAFTGNVTVSGTLGPHGGTRLASNTGAFDLAVADWFFRTLDGTNGTLMVANEQAAQLFTLELLQDGTGSRTVSWASFGTVTWMTSGGTAPTIAAGAGLRSTLLFKRIAAGVFLGWMTGSQA